MAEPPVSFPRQLRRHADRQPSGCAVRLLSRDGSEESVTWAELEAYTNQAARWFQSAGIGTECWVALCLSNSIEHIIAAIAAWKVGAGVLPVNVRAPESELRAILDLAQPALVVGGTNEPIADFRQFAGARLRELNEFSDEQLPDQIACPGKAIASGGSTGRPKIIVDPKPWAQTPGGFGGAVGFRPSMKSLVAGPLYHNGPFGWSHLGLFDGNEVTLMQRFDPETWLIAVERFEIEFAWVVPTMMKRIADYSEFETVNLSSLEALVHAGGPCPEWLKRRWIDRLAPDRVYESYGATEAVGGAAIRGDEWLEHPASVGRPFKSEVAIRDEDGQEVPVGSVGEIFMRPHGEGATYAYLGAESAPQDMAGFTSVGDLGWLDNHGYLYISDRRTDLIVSGGSNVFPAEVESVITSHPQVADAAVIGLLDPEWGSRVHGIVVARDQASPPDGEEIRQYVREHLVAYKVPKTIEFVSDLPRAESGKIRRSALRDERQASARVEAHAVGEVRNA